MEQTVDELVKAGCIGVKEGDMELEPANLGRVAAFYGVAWQTVELFREKMGDEEGLAKRKMKYLLEVVANATEFEGVPVRHGEAQMLQSLTHYLTYPMEPDEQGVINYNAPTVKTNMLL